MKTKEEAQQFLEELEIHCKFMYQDECGADGIYLSDGVYVDALDYAIMQGDLSKKQEKLFDKAINILYPDAEENNDE
jgi:hypothetical protein